MSLRQVCIRREKRRKESNLEWADPTKGLGHSFNSARPVPESGEKKQTLKNLSLPWADLARVQMAEWEEGKTMNIIKGK